MFKRIPAPKEKKVGSQRGRRPEEITRPDEAST